MSHDVTINIVHSELETGVGLLKCQKCGCMANALKALAADLPSLGEPDVRSLARDVESWLEKMQPVQYSCLGCEHCYPAVAQNALAQAFPSLNLAENESCEFRERDEGWPLVAGEYFVLDKSAPIAVSTLASVELAEALAQRKPNGLAIVGKTETENIGIDKIIKNVVSSSTLRHLIIAGVDSKGHQTGNTLVALKSNGVDENGRVIGSTGKRPILRNVSSAEIAAFREQVQIVDLIGCENLDEIVGQIEELSRQPVTACGCSECGGSTPVSVSTVPKVAAIEPHDEVKLDKQGYFVVVPSRDKGIISVEHYSYDNTLLRNIEGSTARAIYATIIAEGWVSELSHAAYLGKELAKAELSLQNGFKYVQDGA